MTLEIGISARSQYDQNSTDQRERSTYCEMVLTVPHCPMAAYMMEQVKRQIDQSLRVVRYSCAN